jgi:hypothetical protein
MKIKYVLFLVISSAPMVGRSYAATSNPMPQNASPVRSANNSSKPLRKAQHATVRGRKPSQMRSEKRQNYRSSNASHVATHGSMATVNRSQEFSSSEGHSARSTGDLAKSGQVESSALAKTSALTKKGPMQRKPMNSALAIGSPVAPSSSPSLGNMRHRGPNPAVIGGSGMPQLSNNTGLNGSRMSRRP